MCAARGPGCGSGVSVYRCERTPLGAQGAVPVYRSIGASVRRSGARSAVPVYRCIGVSVYRCIGAGVRRPGPRACIGVSVYRCGRAPFGARGAVPLYRYIGAGVRRSGSGARYRCIGVALRACAVRGPRARYRCIGVSVYRCIGARLFLGRCLRPLCNSCSCNPSSDCELDRALRKNSDMFVFGMRSDNNSSLLFGLTSSERHKDHGWSDRQSLDLLTAVRRGTCTVRHEMIEATALSPWDPTSATRKVNRSPKLVHCDCRESCLAYGSISRGTDIHNHVQTSSS